MRDHRLTPESPRERQGARDASPAGGWWIIYLFFKPAAFFKHFVLDQTPALTALAAWIYGMAGVIDRIDTLSLQGRDVPFDESWFSLWAFIIFGGVFSGLLYFAIGGWWYRKRIRWSGEKSVESALARRVYIYASLVYALPILIVQISESLSFPSPQEYADAEGSAWYFLLLALPFWSFLVSYVGVRTVFVVRRGLAILWFLVLPGLLSAVAFAGLIWAVFQLSSAPADLKNTSSFSSATVSFKYPGNWTIDLEDEHYDPNADIIVEPVQDAFSNLLIYETDRSIEEVLTATVGSYKEAFGRLKVNGSFDWWGQFEGLGRRCKIEIDSESYVLRLFVADAGSGFVLEVREFYLPQDVEQVIPGFELIEATFDLSVGPADVANPSSFTSASFSFKYPGNWWIDKEHESHDPDTYIFVEPLQDAYARVQVYESEDTVEQEFAATLESYQESFANLRERGRFAKWGRFAGQGWRLEGEVDAESYVLRVFMTEVTKGTILEVHELYAVEVESDVVPGFGLIRSSFRHKSKKIQSAKD